MCLGERDTPHTFFQWCETYFVEVLLFPNYIFLFVSKAAWVSMTLVTKGLAVFALIWGKYQRSHSIIQDELLLANNKLFFIFPLWNAISDFILFLCNQLGSQRRISSPSCSLIFTLNKWKIHLIRLHQQCTNIISIFVHQ